jgi:hypothetical protein
MPGRGAGAVAFEGQQFLACPEDRLDALPDRCEVWPVSGLVFAAGADDGRVELADGLGELAAGVAFVAEQRFASAAPAAGEHFERDVALVAFGRGERQGSWGAVRGEDRVQPEAPEEAVVAGAPAVVGRVCQRRSFDGFAAAGALNRCGVDQQQVVGGAGALAREHAHKPLDRVREAAAALEVARLRGQLRKQMRKPFPGHLEETAVAGDPHDRLRHAQGDDLRVCDHPTSVPRRLRQEIVSRAIHGDAESVEVGVHRGLLVDGVLSTADFDPSAPKPSTTANAVESLI